MPAPKPPPLEKRPYGPDSSPADIEALRSQVYQYDTGVVMYIEAPVITIFQIHRYAEKLTELSEAQDDFALIIDLTIAPRPNSQQRQELKKMFASPPNMGRVGVFTARNVLLNMAAKFVLSGIGFKLLSVNKTLDQALKAIGHGP